MVCEIALGSDPKRMRQHTSAALEKVGAIDPPALLVRAGKNNDEREDITDDPDVTKKNAEHFQINLLSVGRPPGDHLSLSSSAPGSPTVSTVPSTPEPQGIR
jgi:hypothetical protein